ncbi:UNVERIFIED_CONTAM: hypothetical protein Sradi_4010600 [Sesamum radiatum]|uniref:Retrotransposon gag domain-containing protein n=1 Tax=Sesamum radiatum TaxID=300843 RepID=A0AAW2PHE0_SESRA
MTAIQCAVQLLHGCSIWSVDFVVMFKQNPIQLASWSPIPTIYTVPEEQRVSLASGHLEGRAELWFQGLVEKGLPTWQQFIEAVYERLDPGAILGEFNTLQQGTITVEQYLERFEEVKSHVMIFHSDFPESYYVTCFINGLRPTIKGPVISMRPTRLYQAVALVKN